MLVTEVEDRQSTQQIEILDNGNAVIAEIESSECNYSCQILYSGDLIVAYF